MMKFGLCGAAGTPELVYRATRETRIHDCPQKQISLL